MEFCAHRVGAVGLDVDQQGRVVADGVEFHQVDVKSGAAHDCLQMNQQIGGAAAGHQHPDGIADGVRGNDLADGKIFFDHFHDPAAAELRLPGFFRGNTQTGSTAGQRHAQRFAQTVHGVSRERFRYRLAGVGGAHNGAGADAAVQTASPVHHFLPRQLAGNVAVVQLEGIGAAAQRLSLVIAREHGAAGKENGGLVHRHRRHELGGDVLVAAADEDDPVKGVPRHQLFGLNGQKIPVDQAGQVKEDFADGQGIDLQREAARSPDAPLDRLGQLAEMQVAGVCLRPGIDNADDGLADIDIGVAHGLKQGAAQQLLPVTRMLPFLGSIVFHGIFLLFL